MVRIDRVHGDDSWSDKLDILKTLRHLVRIRARPSDRGISRGALLSTYFRLHRLSSKLAAPGKTQILDYEVAFLDSTTLFQLYEDIFLDRVYEFDLQSESPIIIDCGSNIGVSILYFKSLYPNARVLGFEPHPGLYDVLEANVSGNNLEKVELFPSAVGGETGSLELFVNDEKNAGSLNMGFFQREAEAKPISVPTVCLSDYINETVDLVKLDIEGAEESVLQELQESGKLSNIRRIVCEYHHHIDVGVDRFSKTLSFLEDAGFGYQLLVYTTLPPKLGGYQDVMVYAFNKANP